MMAISAGELAGVIGGELHCDPQQLVTGAVVDSRLITPGAAFVAIEGERVDGHDFAEGAIAHGAVVAITQRLLPIPCIVVADPVAALGEWARWWRNQLTMSAEFSVIAITGSSGKTSTKDLLAAVLQSAGPTVAAQGSLNTEVGVPLTILSAPIGTKFLVVEMGMRGAGHIRYLCSIASPDIAVITNVGSAHLGLLGSRSAIAHAKAEILEGLSPTQCAIVPGTEPLITAELHRTSARVVTFGEGAECEVRAERVGLDAQARAHFELVHGTERAPVSLAIHGEHFVANALAVAAVALNVGLSVASVAEQLSSARIESKWRMEVTTTPHGVILINDTYNANPESMRAALKSLASMRGEGRSWAVLGEMLELGSDSVEEHDAIGRLAVRLDISQLICVGAGTRVMHLGASNEGSWGEESRWVPDAESALAILRSETRRGDIVLVKASRGIGLDSVAAALSAGVDGADGGETA
jgi:UDP-N-acetylmuramoyl-tripeptide--D-alanyl-D-alanine ligase